MWSFRESFTRLIPEEWRSPPDVFFRARVLLAMILLLLVKAPIFVVVGAFFYRLPAVAGANGLAALLALGAFAAIATRASLSLATDLLCAGVLVAVLAASGSVEGLTSAALPWLAAVPLAASMGGGWRRGLVWTVVSIAGIGVLAALSAYGLLPNQELPVEIRRVTAAWNVALFLVFLFFAATAYESVRVRAMTYLHDLHRAEHARIEERASLQRLSSIGSMASSMAHEARAPVAQAMAGLFQLRRELGGSSARSSPETQSALGIVDDCIAQLRRVSDAAMDLQSLSPVRSPNLVTFDIAALVQELVRGRAAFRLELDEHLRALGDAHCMRQVLSYVLELCARTYDYSAGPIHVSARALGDSVSIIVLSGRVADETVEASLPPPDRHAAEAQFGVALCQLLLGAMNGTLEKLARPSNAPGFQLTLPRGEVDELNVIVPADVVRH